MKEKTMNVLLCIDDLKWDYTRHCAVTILSLLDTNKKHKIKIYIMSSCLPQENINELKRIVDLYDQKIEFIIRDNLIPKEVKESVINRRNLTRWTWYRLFFPLYIKDIERLLYIDCDVIITKDIGEIYNMDMQWKAIAWYYDINLTRYVSEKNFESKNYINAWVILIDTEKFKKHKIDKTNIEKINDKYWKYIDNADQDYLNIIFKDDIYIYGREMNYLVEKPFWNKWIKDASIYHCLAKNYIQNSLCPKRLCDIYYHYLDQTKRSDLKYQKRIIYFWFLYDYFYQWLLFIFNNTIWIKYFKKVHDSLSKIYLYWVKIIKR